LFIRNVIKLILFPGLTIDECVELDQETRNFITVTILRLLLREIFIYRYMQTDPNWANFMYNPNTNKVNKLSPDIRVSVVFVFVS